MSAKTGQPEWPDPTKVAADVYKVLLENDRVRVADVRFKPGQQTVMHGHPNHVIYVLAGFKLGIEVPDGAASTVDLETGQTLWMKAGPHAARNVGGTEGHALVVELKEPI